MLQRLQAVAESSSHARTLVLNLAILGFLLFIGIVLWQELRTERVVIGPIRMPEALAAQGLDGDVIAARIREAIGEIEKNATTGRDASFVRPATEFDVEIPGVGISLQSVTRFLRRFFGFPEHRVTGDVTCPWEMAPRTTNAAHAWVPWLLHDLSKACHREAIELHLRMDDEAIGATPIGALGAINDRSESDYFTAAARAIVWRWDPYALVSYYYGKKDDDPKKQSEDLKTAELLAKSMDRYGERDRTAAVDLLGLILFAEEQGKDQAKAVADGMNQFERAIDLDNHFAPGHHNLGIAYLKQNYLEKAIAEFLLALKYRPNSAISLYSLGEALAENKEDDLAMWEFQRAIAIKPDYAFPHEGLAGAYHRRGYDTLATSEYKKALDIDPKNPDAYEEFALMREDDKHYGEAIRLLEKAAEIDAHKSKDFDQLAQRADNDGDERAAARALYTLAKLQPHTP